MGLILLVLVALAATACSDSEPLPTLVPLPTYTPLAPLPTYTPMPTYTPVPRAIPLIGVQKKEVVVEKIVVQTVVVVVTASPLHAQPVPTATAVPAVPAKVKVVKAAATDVPMPVWIPMTVDVEILLDIYDDNRPHVLTVITNSNDEIGFTSLQLIALDEEGLSEGELEMVFGYPLTDIFVPANSTIGIYGSLYSNEESIYEIGIRPGDKQVFWNGYVDLNDIGGVSILAWAKWRWKSFSRIDPNNNDFFSLEGDWIVNRTDKPIEIVYACDGYLPINSTIESVMAVRHTLFGNETNAEDKSPLPAFAKLPELSHLRVRTESSVYRDIEPKSKIGMPTLIMSDSDDIIVSCHSWFIYSR